MVFYTLLKHLPAGHYTKVFLGVCVILGASSYPLLNREKKGHDLFSSERPEELDEIIEQARRQKRDALLAARAKEAAALEASK